MNKNRFRIVFNKARNLMMAVAENTTSQGKGQQSGSGQPNALEMQSGSKQIALFQLRPLAFAALCMFGLQPVLLHAAVIADANAPNNNKPLIDITANGLPLVQITTPSAAGVSRNQYSQFNVDPGGVILNNNSQSFALTQQAGYVGANPYLDNGSARIILNEVTGSGPSSLRGYTEVAGQRAEVIIANPNGIVCDGCGFINTSRGILTTGVPIMGSGGSLDSFRVTGGQIQIGAGGINASNMDQLDLISRSLQVNGEIWANNLNAVVGANLVDYATLGVQVIAGDANKPTVGIDVALLGGMYANKIRLVGTEAGVGVNSVGNMEAQAGGFSLDNRGNITLNGRTSSTANLAITTQGDIANSGTLEGNSITSTSNAFNNTGVVQADALTLNATSLSNQGANAKITAVTSANLAVSGDINNDATIAGAAINAYSQAFNNTGTVQADTFNLDAARLNNLGTQAKITANTEAHLTTSGDINNTGIISGSKVNTSSYGFSNAGSVQADALMINAYDLSNMGTGAKIAGNISGNLNIANNINNEGTLAATILTIANSNVFSNTGNVIADVLNLNAGTLNNLGSTSKIIGKTSADFSVTGDIDNQGELSANTLTVAKSNAFNNSGNVTADKLTVNADSINNVGVASSIAGLTSVDLNALGDINNEGTIDSNTVTTHSQSVNNRGSIFGNVVTLNATDLNNSNETAIIAATDTLNLFISNALNNTAGATLYSMGDLNAAASGTVDANGYLTDSMKVFNNVSSTVQAEKEVRISADQITNKRTFVKVDSTAVAQPEVKTVTTDEHKILSIVDDVVNPDGSITYGYVKTVDIHSVAQVQGGTTVLSYTVAPTETVTVTQSPDPAVLGFGYDAQLAAYNAIITPSVTKKISCEPCYIPTITTESVNVNTTPKSNLLAGGSMHLKGAINNQYSTIAAGYNIAFNAGGPLQQLTTGEYITPDPSLIGPIYLGANGYTQQSQVLISTVANVGTTDNWQWVVVGGHDDCYPCHWVYNWGWANFPLPYSNTATTQLAPALQTLGASFTAGKSITGTASIVNNLATNATAVSSTLGALQSSATSALQSSTPPLINITLPTNGLFHYNTAPNPAYIIETNPRFANYRDFLSSAYMLSRLTFDPQQIQKRLGDGFYEQKLVTDQITGLTGRKFLPQYASAEEEFKALMDQGLAEAHTQNLAPGVALTSAQVAALTHDIVWMVAQEVNLPNGTKEKLLVPQVFLTRVHANDLRANGSLIAAENIDIKTSGTLLNSGTILGTKNTSLSATDVVNKGGTISSGGDTVIVASNDIKNLSGTISGGRVALLAGHDIVNDTEMEALQLGNVFTTRIHGTASIAAADTLDIRAGHDVSITGAKVTAGGNASIAAGNNFTVSVLKAKETAHLAGVPAKGAVNPDGSPNLQYALAEFNRGDNGPSGGTSSTVNLSSQIQTGGNLTLLANNDLNMTAAQIYAMQDLSVAARNITLNAAKDVAQSSFDDHSGNSISRTDEKVVGTLLQAGNNVQLTAGGNKPEHGNITISGSQISSQSGKVALAADNNVTVNAVDERHDFYQQRTSSSSGFLSSSSTTEIKTSNEKIARGSSIDGDSVTVKTGHDINVVGSDIVATNGLSLEAKNNINLQASENSYTSGYFKEEKKSGLMSGGGLSISYGEQKQKNIQTSTDVSHTASNIGSLNGNVNIKAGNGYTQTGSNVTAAEGDINIAAQEVLIKEVQNTGISHSETKFEQSGLTLSLSNAVVNAENTVEQQRKASTQTSSGRMKALAAANALMSTQGAFDAVSKGATGDMMDKAGGVTISLSIGGSTSESSATQTYSKAQGSSVTAGGNINIVATSGEDNTNHTEQENVHDDHGNSLSNTKRGNITIQGSNIKAGNDTSLTADNDINLLAAKNTAEQHSTNSSSSGSLGVGFSTAPKGGGFSVTASASMGRGNADGSDVSWTNTHVEAGNTLNIKSGRDTNMKGAVASGKQVSADIGGNLNIESLQDTSVYDSQQKNMGMSISVPIAGAGGGGSINASNTNINSNYASVVEQSGIKAGDGGYRVKVKGNTDLKGAVIAASDTGLESSTFETGGTLTQSDIQNSASYDAESMSMSAGVGASASASAGVGNDSGNASSTTRSGVGVSTKTDTTGAIAKIFDEKKVNEEVSAQTQITQSFSQQAPKAVADFSGSRAKDLRAQADAAKGDPQKQKDLLAEAEKWDEGGIYRVVLHTVSGALSGGAAGAAGAVTTASAAPLLDELQANVQATLVKQGMSPEAAKLVAQGVAEATSAGMGAAAGGVQGAATGLTVDTNNRQLHPSEERWLKEKAKIFAKREGISEEIALERLTQQSLKEVDYLWRAQLSDGDDNAAKSYLASNNQTFTNDLGEQQKLFTAQGQQLFRPEMFGDTADPAFYKQFAHSGISRSLSAGLAKELKDSGISLKNGAIDLAKAARDNPGMVLDALFSAFKGVPKAVKDSFIETGNAIGEGSAVAFNKEINAKLNAIYGNDVSGYQEAMLMIRTLSAISGAAGVAKVGGDMSVATAKAVNKKLDEELVRMAQEGLIKSAGAIDPKTGKPVLNLNELAELPNKKNTTLKGATGDFFGDARASALFPESKYLGGSTLPGENGLDSVFAIKSKDVDYLIVENKYNSSRQGNPKDGLQGSEDWILGSDRIEHAVGKEAARDIRASIADGRTETLLIRTLPDGRTEVKLLDAVGKPKPLDQSRLDIVNRISNLNREVQP